MDGNGDRGLVLTIMSPGFDNWQRERQCSSTHGKSVQPYRSATEPEIEPEKKFGKTPTLFVGGEREEGLPKESEKGTLFVGGEREEGPPKANEKGNKGVAEVDESPTSDHIRAVHAFKFVLIEHLRDVLKPFWQQGNLSKDAYKIIIKKSMDKIIGSIQASKFPRTKTDHQRYLSASKSKIFDLIQAYVKKYQKANISKSSSS